MGPRAVLAIDPGYRTGCKMVCLDPQGKLLANAVIYVNQSAARSQEASQTILDLIQRFHIEAIAIGNGTASRETEEFIRGLSLPDKMPVVMVNESGASIYSASAVAREEFPDQDITVRGAVSIGRRLLDPLAELVKIDPKSIGVGQYQHDVDQGRLKSNLDETVMSCVNEVGVKVNTASQQLLTYVSGLGPTLAKTVIAHRNENGPFRSCADLKKVPQLGPKAFELAKPGRDPREHFEAVAFAADIRTIDRLTPGMKLAGIVTNVTNFGAFVDIGVHQDGLVHISELSDKFVKNPADVVSVNQKVSVTVLTIDPERKRISLSMRSDASPPGQPGSDT